MPIFFVRKVHDAELRELPPAAITPERAHRLFVKKKHPGFSKTKNNFIPHCRLTLTFLSKRTIIDIARHKKSN
jgi:hypothetical protein